MLWVLSGGDTDSTNPDGATAPTPARPLLEVGTMLSNAQTLTYTLPLRGYTEASRRVEVRAQTSGLISRKSVAKGSVVEKGEILCRMDPGERSSRLTQARARALQEETNAVSISSLAGDGYASEIALRTSEANLAAAHAEIEQVELDLARTIIRAPFAGILETDSAETGSLLLPGSLCATVVDLDPARIVGFAPERFIQRFKIGIPATATLATGETATGSISFVAQTAEARTRTFRIELTAPNSHGSIRAGLSAEINIPVSYPAAHLVPQSALTLSSNGEIGLRIIAPGSRARFLEVQLLHETPDGIWIDGLPPTAEIIVVGQDFVQDGASVITRPALGIASQ